MDIYNQVMFLYGTTFLISMFVAFIIWIISRMIGASNGKSFFTKRDPTITKPNF